jgi:hypothetical protein
MHLGRRFALGDRMPRFARTVGRTFAKVMQGLGPYTAIALIVPGGSLIALAAWTIRHRTPVSARFGRLLITAAAFGAAVILPGNP